jgi:hypothetical protein
MLSSSEEGGGVLRSTVLMVRLPPLRFESALQRPLLKRRGLTYDSAKPKIAGSNPVEPLLQTISAQSTLVVRGKSEEVGCTPTKALPSSLAAQMVPKMIPSLKRYNQRT